MTVVVARVELVLATFVRVKVKVEGVFGGRRSSKSRTNWWVGW